MLGKPAVPAFRAAEDRALVPAVDDAHFRPAMAARKDAPHRTAELLRRVLPVEALAAGRAEFLPPVVPVRHLDEDAAADAAERAQGFRALPGRRVVVHAVPVGVAAAEGAAVFLRNTVCRKGFAAHEAPGRPLHGAAPGRAACLSSFMSLFVSRRYR